MNSGPPLYESAQPPATPGITQAMVESLKKTKPWVRFVSIMGFIAAGLLVLLGIVLVLGAGFISSWAGSEIGRIPIMLVGCFYGLMGLICIIPSVFLYRYADGIKKALKGDLTNGIEFALKSQQSFWTFVGVLLLIVLLIQAAILFFLVIIMVFGLLGLRG